MDCLSGHESRVVFGQEWKASPKSTGSAFRLFLLTAFPPAKPPDTTAIFPPEPLPDMKISPLPARHSGINTHEQSGFRPSQAKSLSSARAPNQALSDPRETVKTIMDTFI